MSGGEQVQSGGWLRIYRPAWWSLAGLAGTLGVAGVWLELGAGSALLLLTGFAVLGALGFWQFGPQQGEGRPGRAAMILGTACSLGFLALIGLGYVAGPVGFAIGVAIAAAGWPVLRRRRAAPGGGQTAGPERARPTPVRARAVPAPPSGPPLESVPAAPLPAVSALPALSTPQLCWAWRASYVCLCRSPWPSYRESLADLRRACLDELERRDPVAFGRWFPTARAASDPARYFCAQSQP